MALNDFLQPDRVIFSLRSKSKWDIVGELVAPLFEAGIVKDEKRGTMVYYQLRCPCILDFFGCIETVVQANAREQMELVG